MSFCLEQYSYGTSGICIRSAGLYEAYAWKNNRRYDSKFLGVASIEVIVVEATIYCKDKQCMLSDFWISYCCRTAVHACASLYKRVIHVKIYMCNFCCFRVDFCS